MNSKKIFMACLSFHLCASSASSPEIVNAMRKAEPSKGRVFGYDKPPDEIAQSFGYSAEVHAVTTEDGYILNLYRIPRGKEDTGAGDRPAVLVMHGLGTNAGSWFGSDEKSLPFLMADEGFDVWLGCPRGSIYSRQHVKLTPDSGKFWEYSWHEMGIYDIPDTVSYILNKTRKRNIQYIGHSMGTTMFFVWCSLLESCRERIHSAYLIAPVAYVHGVKGLLRTLSGLALTLLEPPLLDRLSKPLLHETFDLSSRTLRSMFIPLCVREATWKICSQLMADLFGPSPHQGLEEVRIFLRSSPDSVSHKQFAHFGQAMSQPRTFRMYDYGPAKNRAKYGTDEPPAYPLLNVTIPVSLYYGKNDNAADPQDVLTLRQDLPNVKRLISFDSFNHVDFILGRVASADFSVPLVKSMKDDLIT